MTRRRLLALALACAALPACGDGTGSRPSLRGQWLYRVLVNEVPGAPGSRCSVSGAVTFQESGGAVSGRMPHPMIRCASVSGGGLDGNTLDSTTTVTGTVSGDSLLLTLQGPGVAVRQSVRLLGDSLTGRVLEAGGGIVGGRLFADSVRLGRTTVHVSGGVAQTQELYARMDGPALKLVGSSGASAGAVVFPYDRDRTLSTGTFTVGGTGSACYGYYAGPFVLSTGHYEPFVDFTAGGMTITHADAQTVRGSIDVSGPANPSGPTVRVQADFVAIAERYPVQF